MTIGKFLQRWASGGTKIAPSSPKQTLGWVDNEQAPFEWVNWLQDRIEEKLERLIQERLDSFFEGSVDPELAIMTGQWLDSWGVCNDTPNTIDGGGAVAYRDMVVIFDDEKQPFLLVIDAATGKIETWNLRTNTLVSFSPDLRLDLPSGGGEVWIPVSMCTDGDYLYMTWTDTNAAPDAHRVHAWEISSWNVKTGWPATGRILSGTGNGPQTTDYRDSKIIIADANNLAISQGWQTVTGSGTAAIQIVAKSNGNLVAAGAGDCPTAASMQPCEGICSDGTNIFFITNDTTTTNTRLCSATIADPTTGSGGTGYPLTITAAGGRLQALGATGLFASAISPSTGADTEILVRTHNASNASLDELIRGRDSAATPLSGQSLVYDNNCWGMTFDGINLWLLTDLDTLSSGQQMGLVKLDVAKLSQSPNVDVTRQLSDLAQTFIMLPDDAGPGFGRYLGIVFDGRDIWSLIEPASGQTHSGEIYRLPLAMFRS